ncbi:HAD family hydrolase [Magnetovibrio sp.]|uniref:HAD family hydrolase n=1 Tax=Magnetovibrio sp. TaxID=2024836 RepID=UPI002F91E641
MKAVIFDVDGTLADTEDAHREAFNDAFAKAGLDWVWDRDLYKHLLKVTGGKQRIRFFLEERDPEFLQRDDIDELIPALHKSKTDFFVARLQNGQVPLRPGIEDLINECRAKDMTIAIATTTTPVNVETLLRVNLGDESLNWFACIGDGGKVPVLKPEPDVYNWVLDQLGLEAKETLALEDSRNGLVACERAHVPCLIVTNDYTLGQDFGGCLDQWESYEGVTLAKLQDVHGRAA